VPVFSHKTGAAILDREGKKQALKGGDNTVKKIMQAAFVSI
jgi:hypothetical protein